MQLYPEGGKEIRAFGLSLSSNMGPKRDAGRGSFVESVLTATETFYGEVLQNLRQWKAAPPKLKKSVEPEESPQEAVAEIVGVEPEQIAAITNEQPESEGVSDLEGAP